jgi:hypothetical protein
VKGTDSDPHELGPKHAKDIHKAFIHSKGAPLCVLQESSGVGGPHAKALSDRRGGAHTSMQSKDKSRRPRIDGRAKVAMQTPTCGGALLEH